MRIGMVIIVTAFCVAACEGSVARLSPAPGATPVPGATDAATSTVDGIRIVARAGAWEWDPGDLESKVTPILIEIRSEGTRAALVRYNGIWLQDEAGHRFAAMPPYDIDESVTESFTVDNPYYGFSGFAVAPYLRPWYPRWAAYDGAFAYDATYYSPFVTVYRRVELPTVDMLQRALPEGVLAAGGSAAGFVYFEALDRDAGIVTLNVNVVDAATGETIGTVSIPFATR
jgi:hypothetical protein